MYCSTCGKSVPTDAAFCSSCGSQTHSSPVNKSNDPEVTVLNEPVENQDGRKYTYIGIAVLILWFIAINPVDGNILGITHLDLAQSDCSSEEYVLTGDSEFDEFFADFDEEITASCKKQKSESMVIMLFGIIGIIYCYFAINRPAKEDSDKEPEDSDIEPEWVRRNAEKEVRAAEKEVRAAERAQRAAADRAEKEGNLNDINWLEGEISRLGKKLVVVKGLATAAFLILCIILFSKPEVDLLVNDPFSSDGAEILIESDVRGFELLLNIDSCHKSFPSPERAVVCENAWRETVGLAASMMFLSVFFSALGHTTLRRESEYIKLVEERGNSLK